MGGVYEACAESDSERTVAGVRKHLRRFLRKVLQMILTRYQPTDFAGVCRQVTPLSMDDLKNAGNWDVLLQTGVVTSKDTPLTISGLRFSRIFPRHLLYCGSSGRVELIDETRAAAIIREATYVAWRNPQNEQKPIYRDTDGGENMGNPSQKTAQPAVRSEHK